MAIRAFITLLCCLQFADVLAQGGSGFDYISPFDSTSGTVGNIDQWPGFQYNEFTGVVTSDQSIGVGALSFPLSYTSNREHSISGLYPTWSFGYGQLVLSKPLTQAYDCTITTNNPSPCSPSRTLAILVDEGGGFVEFGRDYLFQKLTAKDQAITHDKHFLDDSLRRLTIDYGSDGSLPFTHGDVYLLGRDGSQARYQAEYRLTAGAAGNTRFLPVEIRRGNGHKIVLEYASQLGQTASAGIDNDQLLRLPSLPVTLIKEEINGVVQRALKIEYEALVVGNQTFPDIRLPKKVCLLSQTELNSTDCNGRQLLRDIAWNMWLDASGNPRFVVDHVTTPMGYVTQFHYQGGAATRSNDITAIDFATGGRVEMERTIFSPMSCEFNGSGEVPVGDWLAEPIRVVEKITRYNRDRSGNIFPEQEVNYSYQQIMESATNVDLGKIEVVLTTADGSLSRTRKYFGVHHVIPTNDPWGRCYIPVAQPGQYTRPSGSLEFSSTQYDAPTPPHGWTKGAPVSPRRTVLEYWTYDSLRLFNNDSALAYQEQVDAIASPGLRMKVTKRYVTNASGHFQTTAFDYPIPRPGLPEVAHQNLPMPSRIIKALGDFRTQSIPDSAPRIEQYFTYLHRGNNRVTASGVIHSQLPAPYVIGLTRDASATWFDGTGDSALLGRSETDYHDQFPLAVAVHQYRDSVNRITQYSEYYDATSDGGNYGYLKRSYTGSPQYATSFEQYRYGNPQLIKLPSAGLDDVSGTANTQVIKADGTILELVTDGILQAFEYDGDRRLTQVKSPDPDNQNVNLRATIYTEYSAPGVYPASVKQWEINSGAIYTTKYQDGWGREIETRQSIDPGVVSVSSTEYDKLGRVRRTVSPRGAVTLVEGFDVLDRPLKTSTWDIDPVNAAGTAKLLAYQEFEYGSDSSQPGSQKIVTRSGVPCGYDPSGTEEPGVTCTYQLPTQEVFSDMLGRTYRAGTNGRYTNISYEQIAGGFGFKQTIDVAGQVRTKSTDLLGNMTSEYHPEIGSEIYYYYDTRGLLQQVDHPDRSVFSIYDERDRIIASYAQYGQSDPIPLLTQIYHPVYAAVEASTNEISGTTVHNTFDKLGRVNSTNTQISGPRSGPAELSPDGSWTSAPNMVFQWQAVDVKRIWLELKMEDLPALVFYSPDGGAEYSLDRQQMLDAISRLRDQNETAATVYQDMVEGQNTPLFLDSQRQYQWRVRVVDSQFEPTLWSDWATLSDFQCQVDFQVHDGQEGEPPLVRWDIYDCPDTSAQWTPQVMVSTVTGATATGCELTDQIFHAGRFLGNRSTGQWFAYFMSTGYGLDSEGNPVPPGEGVVNCPPQNTMDFTLRVVDNNTGNELYADTLRGRMFDVPGCFIKSFNAIRVSGALPPILKWQYSPNCTAQDTVTLTMSTLPGDVAVSELCQLDELELHQSNMNLDHESDQWVAFQMAAGYSSVINPQATCPGIQRALFSLEAVDQSTGETHRWDKLRVDLEQAPSVNGCRLNYLTSGETPGLAPQIQWSTTPACETLGWQGQILRSSVGITQGGCLLRNDEWPRGNRLQGPVSATFMLTGETIDNISCPPVDEVDISYRLISPDGDLYTNLDFGIPPTRVRASDIRAPVGDECQVLHFAQMNGYHGSIPYLNWATHGCDDYNVEVKVSTPPGVPTVLGNPLPAVCVLDDVIVSERANGPAQLGFMLGGYYHNHVHGNQHNAPPQGAAYCDLGDIGGLYTISASLTVRDQAGNIVLPVDHILVNNDNRPEQNDTVAAGEMCEIQDPVEVAHAGYNVVPMIMWMTTCPSSGRYQAQVVATPLAQNGLSEQCTALEEIPFQTEGDGPKPARFLRNGYWDYVSGTVRCQPRSAEFSLRIIDTSLTPADPGYVVSEQTTPVVATFSGEQVWDPNVPSCNTAVNPHGSATAPTVPGACTQVGNGLFVANPWNQTFGPLQLSGGTAPNGGETKTITLSTQQPGQFQVSGSLENGQFDYQFQNGTILSAANLLTIRVTYNPNSAGFHSGALILSMTDYNTGQPAGHLTVGLSGTASDGSGACHQVSTLDLATIDIEPMQNQIVIDQVVVGETFTWHWKVHNRGSTRSPAITNGIWTKVSQMGEIVYTRYDLPSIEAQGSRSFSQSVTINPSSNLNPPKTTFDIYSDADGVICELDETNNWRHTRLDVERDPSAEYIDYTILNQSMRLIPGAGPGKTLPNFWYGDTIVVELSVQNLSNLGAVPAPGDEVIFWICKRGTTLCAPEGIYPAAGREVLFPAINPSAHHTVTWSFLLQEHSWLGPKHTQYDIVAMVNSNGNPSELTILNNQQRTAFELSP